MMIHSLKILILISFSITFIAFNCTPSGIYYTKNNSRVIVEGIVKRIGSGGTRESQHPSGYGIKNLVWITAPRTANSEVYLSSNYFIFKDYVDKIVRVEGEFVNVPSIKYNQVSFRSAYEKIEVDTMYYINLCN